MACDPTDAALELEYNLRTRHPEREAVYRAFAARSSEYRSLHPAHLDLRYAEADRCLVDVFLPDSDAATSFSVGPMAGARPLFVFLHGGYWRALDKSLFSFIAKPFVERGVCVAMPTYGLAPAFTLSEIVDQVEQAMRWLSAGAGSFGWDRERVVLCGHSAGGHLAAMMAACDAQKIGGLGIRGASVISGLFDLEPLLHTNVNRDVHMSEAEAREQSPIHRSSFAARHFLVTAGALETGGFVEQSRRFDHHLREVGRSSEFLLIENRTHFDILEDLADPLQPLHRRTLEMLFA
ncbi:MAG: alpha/beta hydrolase [Lautropia sp.]